jgi:hypothetical protein
MFIVECCGGGRGRSKFRYFCCHGAVWDQLLDLSRAHGWQPQGTTLDPVWKKLTTEHAVKFNSNYHPEEYGKIVSSRDGASMADALERAAAIRLPKPFGKSTLIVEGMTSDQHRMANADLSAAIVRDFIGFLRKGKFSFFWDD